MGQHFNTLVEAARQKFWEASDDPFRDDQNRFEFYGAYSAAEEAVRDMDASSKLAVVVELIDDPKPIGEAADNVDSHSTFVSAIDTMIRWKLWLALEADPEIKAKDDYRSARSEFEANYAEGTKP